MGYGGKSVPTIVDFNISKETLNGYFLEAVSAIDAGMFGDVNMISDNIDGGSF